MNIGYARVSTHEQNLTLQIDALKKYGCEIIYQESISGRKADRPEFVAMMKSLRKGDTVVVWDITRLGRSVVDLTMIINTLKDKGVVFVSLQNNVDTSTPMGLVQYNIFAALAEYERQMIRDRTMAGLASAREKGRVGGRPIGLSPGSQKKATSLKALIKSGLSVSEAAKQLGLGRATAYRYVRDMKDQ